MSYTNTQGNKHMMGHYYSTDQCRSIAERNARASVTVAIALGRRFQSSDVLGMKEWKRRLVRQ